jgi:hypothetical protein
MIASANPLRTGSHKIVVAPKIVVSDVTNIGLSLVREASMIAHFFVQPLSSKILIYSTKIIAFPTTIPASAITQIIDVAEKYSFPKR